MGSMIPATDLYENHSSSQHIGSFYPQSHHEMGMSDMQELWDESELPSDFWDTMIPPGMCSTRV